MDFVQSCRAKTSATSQRPRHDIEDREASRQCVIPHGFVGTLKYFPTTRWAGAGASNSCHRQTQSRIRGDESVVENRWIERAWIDGRWRGRRSSHHGSARLKNEDQRHSTGKLGESPSSVTRLTPPLPNAPSNLLASANSRCRGPSSANRRRENPAHASPWNY